YLASTVMVSNPDLVQDFEVQTLEMWPINAESHVAPSAQTMVVVRKIFTDMGFVIESESLTGLTFSGTRKQFAEELQIDPAVLTRPWAAVSLDPDAQVGALEFPVEAQPVSPLTRRQLLRAGAATAALAACSGTPSQSDDTMPTESMGHTGSAKLTTGDTGSALDPCAPGPFDGVGGPALPKDVADVADVLGLGDAHAAGIDGNGVVVAVVDSGLDLSGGMPAWLESALAVGGLVADRDERGHGTAVIEHLRAAAPGITVRSSKYVDGTGFRNYPVAAFQRAVGSTVAGQPDVVLCSWVMLGFSVALQQEIAHAVQRGITVVFAAGNGTMADGPVPEEVPLYKPGGTVDLPGDTEQALLLEARNLLFGNRPVFAVAHPDAVSVGGMVQYCEPPDLVASEVATSFDSELFGKGPGEFYPGRHVPDVCGLVAPKPVVEGLIPALTATPTALQSTLDRKPDQGLVGEEPGAEDALALTSGTSMAAAHVAGVAAMVLQGTPGLSPRAVRHVLMATAGGESWEEPVGHGRVVGHVPDNRPTSATTWLESGARPFLRARLTDRGTELPRSASLRCPDILLHATPIPPEELQARFGLGAYHLDGAVIGDEPTTGSMWAYVRVGNRGDADWTSLVQVFAIVYDDAGEIVIIDGPQTPEGVVDAGDFVVVETLFAKVPEVGVAVVLGHPPVGFDLGTPMLVEDLEKLVGENLEVGIRLW
ncbi:MAG: S8 family serine peptidase, partial [Myxococcales bacterium]|nr:S8 family serine peptidase [Myxococcales bacterium]